MWVFAKRRFDVVLHTRNPGTGKIFHRHLRIFQRMWEIISSNMFYNAVTQDYRFLCLLWSVIFPRGSAGSIDTKFYRQLHLFGLILMHVIVTTFIFFTDFISWIPINVCTYNIITICVVINCPFISLKIFLAVFNWFCNFFYWFKWIIYFCTEKINIFFAFFNCNLVFTTKGGIVSVVL